MATPLSLRITSLAAYIFMVVMNTLATTLPLNGQSTNEISDRYDTLFAPIGFTFAIWGVIYLLLGVYSVYQLVVDHDWIRQITPWYIASSLLNGFWIIAWHYEVIWASLIIIVGLLVTLIRITQVTHSTRSKWSLTLAMRLPFSVYFGWVTVATVANASALLVQQGFRGGVVMSEEGWTIAIVIIAAAIGFATTLVRSAVGYGLVLVWAFFGILSRHLAPDEWNEAYPGVILTLQIILPLAGIVVLIAAMRFLRSAPQNIPGAGSAKQEEALTKAG